MPALFIPALFRDLRYALRQLRNRPGFTLVCVLTLALGIGANTAVFSVMNAVLLKSLPVSDPARVFYLRTSGPPRGTGTIDTQPDLFLSGLRCPAPRCQGDGSDGLCAAVRRKVAVRYGSQPGVAEGDMVSGNFFSGLGVQLARGRGFTAQDEANHAPVAVISDGYWTERFARNPEILGQTLYVNGVPITIVGIAAAGFEGIESGTTTDFWIPLQTRAELNAWGNPPQNGKTFIANPTWWCMRLIGRLAPGVSKAQAVAEMQPVFQTAAYVGLGHPMAGEKPPTLNLAEAKSFPGYESQYGQPLRMLMTMVGLVLLIALSNVGMLLMARNATRQREFSVRMALGAGRKELLRQLLMESLLLVAIGGELAWLFATLATKALGTWARIESSLAPDSTVLLFTLSILVRRRCCLAWRRCALQLSAGPGLALKTSAATSRIPMQANHGRARSSSRVQMALCVVLLVGGGLLVRTLQQSAKHSSGFSDATGWWSSE